MRPLTRSNVIFFIFIDRHVVVAGRSTPTACSRVYLACETARRTIILRFCRTHRILCAAAFFFFEIQCGFPFINKSPTLLRRKHRVVDVNEMPITWLCANL